MNTVLPFPPKPKSIQDVEIETEQAVLGTCFARPELLDDILAICSPDDFHYPPHDMIADAIKTARSAGLPITALVISSRLSVDPDLIEAGGTAYLDGMRMAAPINGAIALARNLVDTRLRRACVQASTESLDALAQPGIGLLEAMAPALQIVDHVSEMLGKRNRVSIRDAADTMLKEASDRAAGRAQVAATTGLQLLDEAIGGLQGGDLVVYAGRPGMGKSALLMTTAMRAAMESRPIIFFSLEMTQARLLQRAGCDLDFDQNAAQPISYSWFRNGSATHDQIARLGQALTAIPDNLCIIEDGGLNIHDIASQARAFAARHQSMGVVVIDYLQKVAPTNRYRGNRVQEVTEISGAAKALAMQLKWPVVVGAQLNRGVESREEKRPNLSDLRESGSIEQDADAVIGLYRPAYYIEKRKPALGRADPGYSAWELEWQGSKNELHLHVLKNRNGAEDSFEVFCDMRASAIRNERPRGAR